YAAGGIIGGGLLGSFLGFNWDKSDDDKSAPATENPNKALMYFTNQAEFNTLSEATERIFPKNDSGPGAIELGVPYFIDHQLAGSYGYNTQEYMQGPFPKGSPYQGYQTPLKRNEIVVEGIRGMDRESNKKFNAAFRDIEDDHKDQILMNFEDDKVYLRGVKASMFFDLLKGATMAVAYSDPLYGGNINMEGWKIKDYPGLHMRYLYEIDNEYLTVIEPKSLSSQH